MSSADSSRRHLIGVCQLNTRADMEENYANAAAMARQAHATHPHCRMLFFPECVDIVAPMTREETMANAVMEDGPYIDRYRELARETRMWLSLGGVHIRVPGQPRPYNTHLVLNDKGETVSAYRKLHLADVVIPGHLNVDESEKVSRGEELVPPCATPVGSLGLAICYDLNFAELGLWYRELGAQVIAYPTLRSIFTGHSHWESLLRCRALETQCYVIAAAQTGNHYGARYTYGHSMVVDPWGAVVAQCSEGEDMCFAEIKLDYVDEVRRLLPMFSHRRRDLYLHRFPCNATSEGENGEEADGKRKGA